MKLILLLVLGVIAKQAYCDAPERIVGGDIATLGQFKYQASLLSYGFHTCGGSIISERHILTAAHCVNDEIYTKNMVVMTGTLEPEYKGDKHEIQCIRLHPSYTGEREGGWKDDIAVITLKKPIKFNKNQGPIPLATKSNVDGTRRGIVSGWGKTSVNSDVSPILKYIEVNVLGEQRCQNPRRNPPINIKQICTLERVGKGACQGDSGGPLAVDGELAGVVSWVLPCALGVSDVFTNVYHYHDFIKESQSMC